ncbi:MAG: putative basic amino acid antiporter YfcC [Gammaproteobacteria bacterium]|nr:putative basic amino acid antiporter YfcC [Gammaproteobacteria bacterium]
METNTNRWALPHTFVLLFVMIIFIAALTWVVPSGVFERQQLEIADGVVAETVVPGTFRPVAKVADDRDLRQGLLDVLSAPAKGVVHAADVIAFVLVVGGAFGIILRTGAIDRGLHMLATSLSSKGIFVIPIMITLFSLGGSTFGMSEEVLPLYPVVIALMFILRFDSMTAVLILFLGTQAGYIGATINPFSVLLAQAISDVHGNPLLWLRAIAWIAFTGLSIAYTMWYAARVRENPESSPVFASDKKLQLDLAVSEEDHPEFSVRDRIILTTFVLALATITWGLVTRGWYMAEIGAVFLACGLISGAVAKMAPSRIAEHFVDGCRDFVYAAFVIGLTRGILVIAEQGMIIDPLLNGLNDLLDGVPNYALTTLALLAHNVITFFVPSSSGEAALTMPVLAPLGDLVGINRDSLVLAYQFGNGLTNLISPTNGLLLAGLAIARVRFSQWFKVILPFFLMAWPLAAILAWISAYV